MQKTVKLVRDVERATAGKTDRLVLHYTGLDGSTYKPGVPDKIGALAVKLDPATLEVVKNAKEGMILNIEMLKTPEADGSPGRFWNLVKAVAGSSGTFAAQSASSAPVANARHAKKNDEVGVKIGAARNQAIAFLQATKGTKFTLDDVDSLSYEIVVRQEKQEIALRSDTNPFEANREVVSVGSLDDSDSFFDAP